MEDNDSGGFAPDVQAEIRAAAVDAVAAWADGRPPAVPAPTGDALLELIDLAVGEPVPPEYEAMTAEDMGFRSAPIAPKVPPSDFRVVVIGAGVSGMLAAIRLAEAGIEHVVLEKNDDVGGTWLENAYPGAGVDTPSHLYSYSFAPRRWSTHFGKRDEVLTYLRDVADGHDLRKVIRFGTEVASAEYRDQRWIGHDHGGRDARSGRRDHRGRPAEPAEDPRAARAWTRSGARCSTRRAGRRTWTSPGSGWRSSAPARARCRSCPRSPSAPRT